MNEPATSAMVRLAEELTAQAERDEAAAFDRQYQLERRGERAVEALSADGAARARQWAEDDRRDEQDRRFDPEPDDAEAQPARTAPTAARSTPRRPARAEDDDDDDGEDGPRTWLR